MFLESPFRIIHATIVISCDIYHYMIDPLVQFSVTELNCQLTSLVQRRFDGIKYVLNNQKVWSHTYALFSGHSVNLKLINMFDNFKINRNSTTKLFSPNSLLRAARYDKYIG